MCSKAKSVSSIPAQYVLFLHRQPLALCSRDIRWRGASPSSVFKSHSTPAKVPENSRVPSLFTVRGYMPLSLSISTTG